MANDGGLMAKLEQWMADTLAALTSGGEAVFKTADIWKYQIATTAGGIEAFDRYEPFAFVSYQLDDTAREGDNDLRQVLNFAVLIGVVSKSPGVARTGNSRNLGTSKIRDFVITAFDSQRPDDESIKCDEFYYAGGFVVFDSPKRHAIQMNFEVSQLTT